MINYIAELVSDYFVESKIVSAEDKSIYKYGTEVAISSVLGILVIILISALFGRIQDGILFLLCFIPIRVYAGGYHMDTYLKCNVIFISIFLLILYVSRILPAYINIGFLLSSLIIIMLLSPIENKYKPISDSEKKKYRKISIIVSILWSMISIILFSININILPLVSLTMFVIAILMIVEKIIQIKNNGGLT